MAFRWQGYLPKVSLISDVADETCFISNNFKNIKNIFFKVSEKAEKKFMDLLKI